MINQEPDPKPELNVAKLAAAEEAVRLRELGWKETEIDAALGAWR